MNLEDILINTANKSNMKHKHACVITYRNKIIAEGYNKYKLMKILNLY